MNTPILISADSFQIAWANAIMSLKENKWKVWDLVVQISKPQLIDDLFHKEMKEFSYRHPKVIEPNKVAYTIFPFRLYRAGSTTRASLYRKYWRYFRWTRTMEHSGWGTYFERMIRYPTAHGDIDQLGSIIDNINNRETVYGSSFVIIIPSPDRDINRIMGAPCLNYITIQVENTEPRRTVNLLAVYRNHDFRARAYGNYLGLCKLIEYISFETNSNVGILTCVSSHAEIPNDKRELSRIAREYLNRQGVFR